MQKKTYLLPIILLLVTFLLSCGTKKFPEASALTIFNNGKYETVMNSAFMSAEDPGQYGSPEATGMHVLIWRNISEEAKGKAKELGIEAGYAYEKGESKPKKLGKVDLSLNDFELAQQFGIKWE